MDQAQSASDAAMRAAEKAMGCWPTRGGLGMLGYCGGTVSHGSWTSHGCPVAVAVADAVAAIAAREALEQAADAWTQGEWALAHGLEGKLSQAQFVGDWLRDRAKAMA